MLLLLLISGLFLGWSLGANGMTHIFGAAIGNKMIKYKSAVIITSIFIIAGALLQGAGGVKTLEKLNVVNSVWGALVVILCAGLLYLLLVKKNFPASISQAIVGAIIGWSFYSGNTIDIGVLGQIVSAWFSSLILGGIFAVFLYKVLALILDKNKIHLVKLDAYLKYALLIVGGLGAYSLGANKVANIVVFLAPFTPIIEVDFGFFTLDGIHILFFIAGLFMVAGAVMSSKKVMSITDNDLMSLSSEVILVIALAHSLVLLIFSSEALSHIVQSIGLPAIPLVPVSSTQVIVGAMIGIGLIKKGREIDYKALGKMSIGWFLTPVISGVAAFGVLFFIGEILKINLVGKSKEVIESIQIPFYTSLRPNLNINLSQPFLYAIIAILLIAVAALSIRLFKLKSKEKDNELDELISNYQSQEKLLKNELVKANEDNAKLEREIDFKQKEQMNIALNIINKNKLLEKLKTRIDKISGKQKIDKDDLIKLKKLIIENLSLDKDRERLNNYINELNRDFYFRLTSRFPNLSKNEQRLCSLIRLNLSSKEIASILNISTKSVEVNRYRLRKKMHLKRKDNLAELINRL